MQFFFFFKWWGGGGGEGREGLIKLFLIEMKKSVEMLHSDEISSQTKEV